VKGMGPRVAQDGLGVAASYVHGMR
jgi:hypothetical protein